MSASSICYNRSKLKPLSLMGLFGRPLNIKLILGKHPFQTCFCTVIYKILVINMGRQSSKIDDKIQTLELL